MVNRMQAMTALVFTVALAACSETDRVPKDDPTQSQTEQTYGSFIRELERVHRAKPAEYSRPFALIKSGVAGPDWLATFHGLPDNRAACEEVVGPYNDDPDLSVLPGAYRCVEIGPDFTLETSLEPQS